MSRVNSEQSRVEGAILATKTKMGTMSKVLTGTQVISKDMPTMLFLDANGAARNVDFPAITDDMKGLYFVVKNTAAGAFALTLRNAAAATIGDLAQAESCMVVCDGAAWHVLMVGTST